MALVPLLNSLVTSPVVMSIVLRDIMPVRISLPMGLKAILPTSRISEAAL